MKNKLPTDKNGNPHGFWISKWENGNLMYKCNYFHDIPIGYNEKRNENGTIQYKAFYLI